MHEAPMRVVARFLPFVEGEGGDRDRPAYTYKTSGGPLTCLSRGGVTYSFNLDHVQLLIDKDAQQTFYEDNVADAVTQFYQGYNTAIVTYGAQGTGKSYTMFGLGSGNEDGMVPRALEDIFDKLDSDAHLATSAVRVGYFEVVGETLRDLLQPKHSHLFVQEGVSGGVTIANLHEEFVSSVDEAMDIVSIGNALRASQQRHVHASTSTAVLQVTLEQTLSDDTTRHSRFTFVDLGSDVWDAYAPPTERDEPHDAPASARGLESAEALDAAVAAAQTGSQRGGDAFSVSGAAPAEPPPLPESVPAWLESEGLAEFVDAFMESGFDDLEVVAVIEEEDFEVMGIDDVAAQAKLLEAVDRLATAVLAGEEEEERVREEAANEAGRDDTSELGAWLYKLKLYAYKETFVSNGYDDMEVVAVLEDEDLNHMNIQAAEDRATLLRAADKLARKLMGDDDADDDDDDDDADGKGGELPDGDAAVEEEDEEEVVVGGDAAIDNVRSAKASPLSRVIDDLVVHARAAPDAVDTTPAFGASKVTSVLRDVLHGNTLTTLVVCCSPNESAMAQSVPSLKFAERVRLLRNRVVCNHFKSSEEMAVTISSLTARVQELEARIAAADPAALASSNSNSGTGTGSEHAAMLPGGPVRAVDHTHGVDALSAHHAELPWPSAYVTASDAGSGDTESVAGSVFDAVRTPRVTRDMLVRERLRKRVESDGMDAQALRDIVVELFEHDVHNKREMVELQAKQAGIERAMVRLREMARMERDHYVGLNKDMEMQIKTLKYEASSSKKFQSELIAHNAELQERLLDTEKRLKAFQDEHAAWFDDKKALDDKFRKMEEEAFEAQEEAIKAQTKLEELVAKANKNPLITLIDRMERWVTRTIETGAVEHRDKVNRDIKQLRVEAKQMVGLAHKSIIDSESTSRDLEAAEDKIESLEDEVRRLKASLEWWRPEGAMQNNRTLVSLGLERRNSSQMLLASQRQTQLSRAAPSPPPLLSSKSASHLFGSTGSMGSGTNLLQQFGVMGGGGGGGAGSPGSPMRRLPPVVEVDGEVGDVIQSQRKELSKAKDRLFTVTFKLGKEHLRKFKKSKRVDINDLFARLGSRVEEIWAQGDRDKQFRRDNKKKLFKAVRSFLSEQGKGGGHMSVRSKSKQQVLLDLKTPRRSKRKRRKAKDAAEAKLTEEELEAQGKAGLKEMRGALNDMPAVYTAALDQVQKDAELAETELGEVKELLKADSSLKRSAAHTASELTHTADDAHYPHTPRAPDPKLVDRRINLLQLQERAREMLAVLDESEHMQLPVDTIAAQVEFLKDLLLQARKDHQIGLQDLSGTNEQKLAVLNEVGKLEGEVARMRQEELDAEGHASGGGSGGDTAVLEKLVADFERQLAESEAEKSALYAARDENDDLRAQLAEQEARMGAMKDETEVLAARLEEMQETYERVKMETHEMVAKAAEQKTMLLKVMASYEEELAAMEADKEDLMAEHAEVHDELERELRDLTDEKNAYRDKMLELEEELDSVLGHLEKKEADGEKKTGGFFSLW